MKPNELEFTAMMRLLGPQVRAAAKLESSLFLGGTGKFKSSLLGVRNFLSPHF